MLDKSLPYFNVLLKKVPHTAIPESVLPEGYQFKTFKVGNEMEWAEIETSVLEFTSPAEAIKYFRKDYLPHIDELKRRSIFIISPFGEKVATATAWWSFKGVKKIQSIHWVAVKPSHQKLGLGSAIINRVTSLSVQIDGDNEIYIHTQTWSYQAISLYLRSGYGIMERETFGYYKNDFEQALPILNEKLIDGIRIGYDTFH